MFFARGPFWCKGDRLVCANVLKLRWNTDCFGLLSGFSVPISPQLMIGANKPVPNAPNKECPWVPAEMERP